MILEQSGRKSIGAERASIGAFRWTGPDGRDRSRRECPRPLLRIRADRAADPLRALSRGDAHPGGAARALGPKRRPRDAAARPVAGLGLPREEPAGVLLAGARGDGGDRAILRRWSMRCGSRASSRWSPGSTRVARRVQPDPLLAVCAGFGDAGDAALPLVPDVPPDQHHAGAGAGAGGGAGRCCERARSAERWRLRAARARGRARGVLGAIQLRDPRRGAGSGRRWSLARMARPGAAGRADACRGLRWRRRWSPRTRPG